MQGVDCEPGTFQLSSLHRNIGMRADGCRTQMPEKKLIINKFSIYPPYLIVVNLF